MKISILSTRTLHHLYFIREVNKQFPVDSVFWETKACQAPFEVSIGDEELRDDYEMKSWFQDGVPEDGMLAQNIFEFESMNLPQAVRTLKDNQPDIIIVFGTGKLSEELINICPDSIINLHGGDPEKYRGLDSHLWSIYHNDFESLVTCLHKIKPQLDTGDILEMEPIPVFPGMQLHQLRKHNTEVCLQIVLKALRERDDTGFASTPQTCKGRYYSFMPKDLKYVCERKFQKYVDSLA